MSIQQVQKDLSSSLPSRFSAELKNLTQLPWTTEHDTCYKLRGKQIEFLASNEDLKMPYRVYYEPFSVKQLEPLSETQRLVVAALFSRHCDGYIREQSLDQILVNPAQWCIPFIIKLSSEYILEIIQKIADSLDRIPHNHISQFFLENPTWLDITKQRMISYWTCYDRYKPGYRQFEKHPSSKILRFFEDSIQENTPNQPT